MRTNIRFLASMLFAGALGMGLAPSLGLAQTTATSATPVSADRLSAIKAAHLLRIGTTGDYKPFYLSRSLDWPVRRSRYRDAALRLFAQSLRVNVEFVQTSWPTLMKDFQDDKFDLAMGGITRAPEERA